MMASQPHLVIVLASASPRRRELLTSLGLEFIIRPAEADENQYDGELPAEMVMRLSLAKAECETRAGDDVRIAADTTVALDNQVLGKPGSAQEAARMLRLLRAREHVVLTGLAVLDCRSRRVSHQLAVTPVRMRNYSDDEITSYVSSGDPMDKAGAYAIQNTSFDPVACIQGCYTNVVGLPLCHLYNALTVLGIQVPVHPLCGCPWARKGHCQWAEPILRAPLFLETI